MAAAGPEGFPERLWEIHSKAWYQDQYRNIQEVLISGTRDAGNEIDFVQAGLLAKVSREKILEDLGTEGPGTSFLRAKEEGWSEQGVEAIKRSLEDLDPYDLFTERILLAELEGDLAQKKALQLSLTEKSLIPKSLMDYAYNTLVSVEPSGLIFIDEDYLCIPVWMLQDVHGIRADVKVLFSGFFNNSKYLDRKMDSWKLNWSLPDPESLANMEESIIMPNKGQGFFFSLSYEEERQKSIENNLYLVGLTSKYSSEPFDNRKVLVERLEKEFLLDQLKVDLSRETGFSTGKYMEPNYILPFLTASNYYSEIGENQKKSFWQDQAYKIAERSMLKTRLRMLIEDSKSQPKEFVKTELDYKFIDKGMMKIKDNVYAHRVEVRNKDYQDFLRYLSENNYDKLYESAKIDLDRYEGVSRTMNKDYHFGHWDPQKKEYVEGRGSSFLKHPAMDMDFDGALIYCEWLTTQYNQQEGRKFQKVKFRLPSQNEWTIAALGMSEPQSWNWDEITVKALPTPEDKKLQEFSLRGQDVWYPWFHGGWSEYRFKLKNRHGCYLANIKTPDTISCPAGIKGDGFVFTSPVGTYFSSDNGLYDMVGNVAEMTQERGVAMGGSYDHVEKECTIRSVNKYSGADPRVGFRLFMEVIEE